MSAFARITQTVMSATRDKVAGVSVEYFVGDTSVTGGIAEAVPSETRTQSDDANGVKLTSTVRDWSIKAADIVIGGIVTEPAQGHKIKWTNNGRKEIYQVNPVGKEKCFRRMDREGTMLRIHTKFLGYESL